MSRVEGFTLLELVAVVLILGLLAAISVPRLLPNHSEANDSAVSHTLIRVRDALETYREKAGRGYPQGTSGEIQSKLNAYLHETEFPSVRIGGVDSNEILIDPNDHPTVVDKGGQGWVYSPSSGEIRINSNAELASQPGSGIRYSDL